MRLKEWDKRVSTASFESIRIDFVKAGKVNSLSSRRFCFRPATPSSQSHCLFLGDSVQSEPLIDKMKQFLLGSFTASCPIEAWLHP